MSLSRRGQAREVEAVGEARAEERAVAKELEIREEVSNEMRDLLLQMDASYVVRICFWQPRLSRPEQADRQRGSRRFGQPARALRCRCGFFRSWECPPAALQEDWQQTRKAITAAWL
jgi:hypothetical protein